MKRWFVVHTRPCAEQKVSFNLRAQNFEVYSPFYFKTRRHARRVERVKMPLFSRYLFVQIDVDRSQWRAINGTFGVNRLVCQGEVPLSIRDELIDEIRAREDQSGAVCLSKITPFQPGDVVRFVAGPMLDCMGIFECEKDDDRIVILLELLGRPTRIAVSKDAVVTCA